MNRVFSGIQPTGNLHLGNYLGAMKSWITMQNEYDDLLFCIVDLHAITIKQNKQELVNSKLKTAAIYLAAGINPEKSTIFNQSSVKEHCELAWILSCNTPMGWLNRMTQFKDKAGKNKEKACLGLYSYPVLMAADILLYNASHVPVGEDQKQHLELARDVATAFNRDFEEIITVPEPIITKGARIMSLKDGTKKMSKSDPSEYSRVNIFDNNDEIVKKIKKAKSDSIEEIYYDKDSRPDVSNLLNIYSIANDISIEETSNKFKDLKFKDLKEALTDSLIALIEPIRDESLKLFNNKDYLANVLNIGKEKAEEKAQKNLKIIKESVGLI